MQTNIYFLIVTHNSSILYILLQLVVKYLSITNKNYKYFIKYSISPFSTLHHMQYYKLLGNLRKIIPFINRTAPPLRN